MNNTVLAFGNNTLVDLGIGSGNDVYLFGKDVKVSGISANSNIYVEGKNAQISVGTGGDGTTSIALDSTGATVNVLSGGHADSEFPFGSASVVATGNGSDTVTGGANDFTFEGAKGHYDINGGVAASSDISGGNGGGTFTGGWYDTYRIDENGNPIFIGDNTITAGTQSSTVVGGEYGNSTLIAAGKAGDVMIAGEFGNDTLSAGRSSGTICTRASPASIGVSITR